MTEEISQENSEMTGVAADTAAEIAEQLAAKLEDVLLIDIGGKKLLLRVGETREVIRPLPLTRVPMGPDHILGLSNIRGQIVCIVDPSKVTGLPAINLEISPESRFVVLRHPRMHVGMWVDGVRAIYQLRSDELPKPRSGEEEEMATGYSLGTVEVAGNSYDVLDCSVIFH